MANKRVQIYTTIDSNTAKKLEEIRWKRRHRSMAAALQQAVHEYVERYDNVDSDEADTGS